jgi:Zn-dependent metalloprotease
VHFESDETIYLVGGQTIASPSLNVAPSISAENARVRAIVELKDERLPDDLAAESELLVYPDGSQARLAYMHTITSPTTGAIRWRVFIDAHTGETILKFNDIHFDGPDTGSGPDVTGAIQSFPIYNIGADYLMIDATRTMYVAPVGNLQGVVVTYEDYYNSGPISTDPDADKVWDDNADQAAAVAGHYYTGLTYDYFLTTHGRNSFDDAGTTIIVNVHDPYYTNNAYWNGEGLNFADGDGVNWRPFSGALDVVAHELGHGVTEYTAGLIYAHQSGAINESYSDVWGAMLDRDDWLLAEDIAISVPYMRNMQNPPAAGDPGHIDDYFYLDISVDNGGVHSNSGIGNRACYQVSTLLSREIMEQIWYRALATYLTPGSGYYFFAGMLMQSTKDLYGPTEIAGVDAALDSVGLNTVYSMPENISFTAAIGQVSEASVWLHNPGPGTKAVTGVAPSIPNLTLAPGPAYQLNIPSGDSSEFLLSYDGAGLTECDFGALIDTLRFDVVGSINTQIRAPMSLSVGYVASTAGTDVISTSCATVTAHNTTGITEFSRSSNDIMFGGSLMVGVAGTGLTAFRDYGGAGGFIPVDTFVQELEQSSFRLSSNDARIQGRVEYQYDGDPDSCEFVIAEYTLYNPCDTALTILTGFFADLDIDNSGTNEAGFDAARNMIYMRNSGDTRSGAFALMNGTPRNLRSIHNPSVIWDGFSDAEAYLEMSQTSNTSGGYGADWSALITFEENDLLPGDSLVYRMAMIYSEAGVAGLAPIHDKAAAWFPGCCVGARGDANGDGDDANILDLTFLVDFIFRSSGDPGACPEEGDMNSDGFEPIPNVIDLTFLVDFIFRSSGIPPGPCP